MKKSTILLALLIPLGSVLAQQNGGMWIPNEINEQEMKALGMKLTAKDIFSTDKPSIKDAIAQFDGGCTSEVISPQGLLLTNHHCGYDNIQSHSTIENDLLTNGFWAKNNSEELPNPGVTADFVVDIKEITDWVLKETNNLSKSELADKISKNIEESKSKILKKDYQNILVRSMYNGNKYYAFVIESYKDVRLVGAPPQSIGKFGSDTDNWVWPRHTGDFSLFRIYANKNNLPAEYSKDNVPYKPKHFLPISIKGIKENDFTFVYGFPGRTNEYLPAIAIEKIINETNPVKIQIRDIALKTLDEKMRIDAATRIKYASKYASVANYWKKWIGETKGLKKSEAVEKRKKYEASLVEKNPNIKPLIDELNLKYNTQAPYALAAAYFGEITRNAETLALASRFVSFIKATEAGKMTAESNEKFKNQIKEFHKDYDANLDIKVLAKLLALYANQSPQGYLPDEIKAYGNVQQNLDWFENWKNKSIILGAKNQNSESVLQQTDAFFNNKNLISELKMDPFVQLFILIQSNFASKVMPTNNQLQEEIDALQKKYMAMQMQTDTKKKFFPDANSTLRVTYGQVKGSEPVDGVSYSYQTTLDGVMEKYIPGDYEFDAPKKLLELYKSKDFGIYKNAKNQVPLAFTATNHTTGGNSGSPALDANGNLIGLNFDRQWEGTMSDINYDIKLCRNIMVDTRYILFVIDKFANAKWLLNEMKILK